MNLAEMLAQIRAAAGRSLSFRANDLTAKWSAGDGSAELEAATAPADGSAPALPKIKMAAYNGGLLQIGWGDPVLVDLTGMEISAKPRPILKDHLTSQVVGHSTEITNTGKKLLVAGLASGTGDAAVEVVANSKNGFPWQASIGTRVLKAIYIDDKKSVEVNGKTWKGPLILVSESVLQEISFVALGGDDSSSALAASLATNHQPTKESNMTPEFKAWLEAQGIDTTALADPLIKTLKASYEAHLAAEAEKTKKPATEPAKPTLQATADADIVAARERQAAETERVAAIRAATNGNAVLEAQAIREGWTAEKTELAVLRASRVKSVSINTGGGEAVTPKVLEAAACMSLGMKGADFEKIYGDQVLQAASRMRNIGLQDVLLQAAVAAGYQARPGCMRADLRGVLQAAFSSNDISGILSNIANKFILESYMSVEQTWRQISAIRPARDFKTMTSYRLTGNLQFEKVGPTGEIKHGDLGSDSFTNKVDTHAKMLGITRQDIINDDLGALQKAPGMIGRGAALQLNEVFWIEFLDAVTTFYASGHGNVQSGGSTALSIDSLTALELLFLNQTDSNSKPLGITPKFLLVPNALNTLASVLTRSAEVRDTTASTKYPTTNPHAGKWEVARSSYLNNSRVAGASATHFFLIADPRELAVIETAFLNGAEQPTLESAEADFDNLGIQIRGFFDFGVKKQDYRAGARSLGA